MINRAQEFIDKIDAQYEAIDNKDEAGPEVREIITALRENEDI